MLARPVLSIPRQVSAFSAHHAPDERPLSRHARSALDGFDEDDEALAGDGADADDAALAGDARDDLDDDADDDLDDDADDDVVDDDADDVEALDADFPLGDGVAERAAVVYCPYCGEPSEVAVDPGGGAQQEYVEDCPVCCRPWRVTVAYQSDGTVDVWAQTDDE
jgi:hypothetical protein